MKKQKVEGTEKREKYMPPKATTQKNKVYARRSIVDPEVLLAVED